MAEEGNGAERSSGRVPPLLTLVLVLVAGFGVVRVVRSDVRAQGFTRLDTRRSRILPLPGASDLPHFVDPRWERWLSAHLAELADVSVFDSEGLQAIVRDLEDLSFVAEVASPEVVWPDGLQVELRFERPVACLRVGGEFLCVSEEGTLLPGIWPTPPETLDGVLPVLSPGDAPGTRPGEWIEGDHRWDALCVARSLERHLARVDRARLGPIVIDARGAREASVREPGIVLDLEHRRRILFGRAPDGTAPGELPPEAKWESVSRGLAALAEGRDWSLLDVRWDEPQVVWRDDDPAPAPEGGE